MADSKLRIPRVALAVLVLGAACGDEENGDDDRRDDGGDDHPGGHDAGDDHEHDAGGGEPDGGSGEPDAGSGEEDDAGSGGEDAGGNGVDVSNARIQRVADDFCEQGFRCGVEEVLKLFDDEAACVADSVTYWQDYVETLGEDCIDSQLDLYACAALLSCGQDIGDDCGDLVETTGELCTEG